VQLTEQKMGMAMVLADLGVKAKTNFLSVKAMFDEVDRDGSGFVDGDELTGTFAMNQIMQLFSCISSCMT
jgi:hypothetical protein